MLLRKHQPVRLCLVGPLAVMAVLVVGAQGAEGAPELLYCMEKTGGKYETVAKCEASDETGTNPLVWEREAPLAGEVVTIDVSSGVGHMSTAKHNIECTSDTGSGEVNTPKTVVKLTITFKGCKDTILKGACNSTEPLGGTGEILTNELTGELVYLKSAAKLPGGLLLSPVGPNFTRISCVGGLIEETVTGKLIGEYPETSVNKMLLAPELNFEENAGKQLWTKIEEGATKFELTAFGEAAFVVSKETVKLLVGGVELTFELMF